MWEWIAAAGGDPLVLNDPGSVAAYSFLQNLSRDGLLHPDSSIAKWDTSNELFARGDVYLMQNWPFGINVIRDLGLENFAVYNGVAGPAREAHIVGGEVLTIVSDTPNRMEAWKFIQFLQSKDAQAVLASRNNWPNIRGDSLASIPASRIEEFEAINATLKHGILRPNISYMGDVYSIMIEAYDRIVNKGEDVRTVLDEKHKDLEVLKAQATM
jgi:trehalose transport system substrate-binding protein